jgi:glycosyltransferase involved in cell wall biosynthesis
MAVMSSNPCPPLVIESFPPTRLSLRVALVTETYPPEINGVAMTLARLVHSLQERNHNIQLIRPRQSGADAMTPPEVGLQEVLMKGLPIPKYPHLRMGLPAKKTLVSLWTRQRPDIVHIATEGPLGWSALQAARKLKLPVSTDFRTNFHAYSRHYGVGWLKKPIAAYLRKFHNLANCTMVPTRALEKSLHESGFERLMVVARGIDTARFSPEHRSTELRAQWGAGTGDPVAIYVGRVAPEKNLSVLARTFNAMQAAQPRLKLVVVGDGPGREEFQTLCPTAIQMGVKTGADLACCYASADLFVFPSLTETYGNVTPEAMASGLAVLAFEHAAAAELIRHGQNGLLAPCDDEDAFIRRGVDMARQAQLTQELRQNARASTLTQDWSHIASQVESVWLDLLRPQPLEKPAKTAPARSGSPLTAVKAAARSWRRKPATGGTV